MINLIPIGVMILAGYLILHGLLDLVYGIGIIFSALVMLSIIGKVRVK